MRKIVLNTNGLKIEYLEGGSGKRKLIMLHGLGGCCEDFEKIIPHFLDKYHVYSFSLPVYGSYDESGRRYTIRTMHRYLKKVLKYLEVENPIIMGHSMGGMIGIHYAASFPRSIDRLITVSTPLSDFKVRLPLEWKLAVKFATENKHAQEVIDYITSRETLFEGLARVTFPGTNEKRKLESARAFLTGIPIKSTGDFYHDLFSYNYKKWVEMVKVPTLMVYGTKDAEIARFRGTALYSLVPKGKIVELSSYHFIPIDIPEEFSKVVKNWLAPTHF